MKRTSSSPKPGSDYVVQPESAGVPWTPAMLAQALRDRFGKPLEAFHTDGTLKWQGYRYLKEHTGLQGSFCSQEDYQRILRIIIELLEV